MVLLKQASLILRKDLLLELRRRESVLTMFFFGTLLLFVFHFAFDVPPQTIAELTPALLWLTFLFTGTLGLAQLFGLEKENRCLDALLLARVDRGALFVGKVSFNFLLMALVEIVVMPLFWILLGTLMSATTMTARARELILPLVLFPLMIPLILATIRCMEAIFRTGQLGDAAAWLRLLIGFDVIFLTVGVLIFDWVVEA